MTSLISPCSHISNIFIEASQKVGVLLRLRNLIPCKAKLIIYKSSIYEAVFISKILFTVQIQLCLLVIQLCPFVIQLSSCRSIMSVCLSIMSSCRSITISHHACLTFNYVRYYLPITASSRLSCTRFANGVEGNSRCERFRGKRRKLSTSINIVE